MRKEAAEIIFMDIRMPGMDGLETMRRILSDFGPERAKIIACSASALTHQQRRYFAGGFDGFIAKPFRLQEICECLEKLLGVTFQYTKTPESLHAASDTLDYTQLKVPKRLRERLKAAAEVYSTTELKHCLGLLETMGEHERRLAARLRELLQSYDMETILNIMAAIETVT
jgi:CheY-like chemotaxis protein